MRLTEQPADRLMEMKSDGSLAGLYEKVRGCTESLCRPLNPEDCVIQSMPDVSPTSWHLAHTTWFFETFVLEPNVPDYAPWHPAAKYLFNSYYNSVGEQFARPQRGLLSRPTVDEILTYRRQIDARILEYLQEADDDELASVLPLIEIGLHHEQQHQELTLTDIKHVFSCNPLYPAYREAFPAAAPAEPLGWLPCESGVRSIGHSGPGFAYDNECPRHRVFLEEFELASRPVTAGEYLEFIKAGGYRDPKWWLSEGWQRLQEQNWRAPLYWHFQQGEWLQFTLAGLLPLDEHSPVCHVSYFEADAFARWRGARLPTEAEWEVAAEDLPVSGNLLEGRRLHPASAAVRDDGPVQMFGDVWEWTASPYSPYPGYQPLEGSLGEYNGKFMCNQFVLRGGSTATPASHIRPTYRNFFPPGARWQFSGFRLAR